MKVAVLALVCSLVSLSIAHPQCLDFQPPYNDAQSSYCTEYLGFGCCWRVTDRRVRKRVDYFLELLGDNKTLVDQCRPFLRNITCTYCNPYAAHIYDTESGNEARNFPWLCRSYCEQAYQHCQPVLLRLFKLDATDFGVSKTPSSHQELVDDSRTFCSTVITDESPYCYPSVLQGPQIPGFSVDDNGELGCVCVLPVATGLRNPVVATHSRDQTGRLFIVEQLGVIRILTADNVLLTQPFLDIRDSVLISTRRADERGFLGLTFHPNYKTNRKFYVYYSTSIGGRHYSKVSEFTTNPDNPNVADKSSEREILRLRQPASNHNGGEIIFKDGYMLIFFGDGGGAGDRFGTIGNGQNTRTLLGSVIRINVDQPDTRRNTAYSVPLDNPFVNDTRFLPEIYAYGLRNPWRCSVDRGDRETGEGRGRIFCGDVGQRSFEEVDIITRGGNYGWRAYEGHSCFDSNLCSVQAIGEVVPPIDVYGRSVGVSITGGFVYRGCLYPNLQGAYIFGDYGSGRVFALRQNRTTGDWSRTELCMGGSSTCTGQLVGEGRKRHVIAFGEDEDGELYVLATSDPTPTATAGVVYQIVDPARRESPVLCKNIRQFSPAGN